MKFVLLLFVFLLVENKFVDCACSRDMNPPGRGHNSVSTFVFKRLIFLLKK